MTRRDAWSVAFTTDADAHKTTTVQLIECVQGHSPLRIVNDFEKGRGLRVRWLLPMQPFLREYTPVLH